MTLNVSHLVNKDLVGVYYIADDGSLEYVGGKLEGNKITASINHFSKYAVLEYNRLFKDVSQQYWAYDVIKKMAAKHIVTGISDTEFKPLNSVTRAEFTTLLVRALDLKAAKATIFKDVDESQWYAEYIAAAYEASIVFGRSTDTFAPNDIMTREEMAIMVVRAYEVLTGMKATSKNEINFTDSVNVSNWAKEAVNTAAEIGLIQSRDNNQFVPGGQANRAESVQVISNLLDNIN